MDILTNGPNTDHKKITRQLIQLPLSPLFRLSFSVIPAKKNQSNQPAHMTETH